MAWARARRAVYLLTVTMLTRARTSSGQTLGQILCPNATAGSPGWAEATALVDGASGAAVIGSDWTAVHDYAFKDHSELVSVTIAGSVESIGASAFYGCTALTSVTASPRIASFAW